MFNTKRERTVAQAKRDLILDRDNSECHVCGYSKDLEVHHIYPLMYGGNSDDDNLITLCTDCHAIVPHEVNKLDTNYEVFHSVFKRFTYLMQTKQRATLLQEMLLEWNDSGSYGWGDLRDINNTCKKVASRIAEWKAIPTNEVSNEVDIDIVVDYAIKEFA